jgi:DNA-binding PadR family transcriptional regulator
MPEKSDIESYLPLTPAVFHILISLFEGEMHGYAIMEEVKRTTEGRVKMGPGTLYGTIKRLLDAKLVAESDRRPDPDHDDERRRYYSLTDMGGKVMKAEIRRYAKVLATAKSKGLPIVATA